LDFQKRDDEKIQADEQQIETAIEKGLIRYKEVRNPYYRSSIAFKLIISDIENNQETIKSFPKHSKKRKRQKKNIRRKV